MVLSEEELTALELPELEAIRNEVARVLRLKKRSQWERNWRTNNRERVLQLKKASHARCRDKEREYQKKWRIANAEYKKAYERQYALENEDIIQKKNQKYRDGVTYAAWLLSQSTGVPTDQIPTELAEVHLAVLKVKRLVKEMSK